MNAQLETIIPSSDSSFVVFSVDKPRFDKNWHYHPEIELIYVIEGAGERYVGDDISPFVSGDLVLVGAGLHHVWRSHLNTGSKRQTGNAQAIVVQFLREILGSALDEARELAGIKKLLQRATQGIAYPPPVAKGIFCMMQELSVTTGWRRMSLLLVILGELSNCENGRLLASSEFSTQMDQKGADRIAKVMNYITENFSRPISLADVAAKAAMSPSAFCRYFQKISGKHLSQFINEVRLANACRLLRETEQDVSSLCFESGFGTLSNFNRIFRLEKGMAPRDFRSKSRLV